MAVLEFDAAGKQFGTVVALDRCSFVARPGRLTGFVGPNGAGKTTAMRAVFGLVELDRGSVRWCGTSLLGLGGPTVGRVITRDGVRHEPRVLYSGGTFDESYPSSVQTGPGTFFTVFYDAGRRIIGGRYSRISDYLDSCAGPSATSCGVPSPG